MMRSTATQAIPTPHEGAGPSRAATHPKSGAGPAYLRRYAVQAPRRRHGKILVGILILVSILFSKVWEGTLANTLSMDRDRLRREVSGLQNRIRLSSDVRDQAALKEGIDSQALRAQGFVAPDPARIIEIDLRQAMPRTLPHAGVVARVETWLRSWQRRPGAPAEVDAQAVPVRAAVGR